MIKAISNLDNVIQIPCMAHTFQLVIEKRLASALVFIACAKRLIWFFMYLKQMKRLKATQVVLNYQKVLDAIGDVSTY